MIRKVPSKTKDPGLSLYHNDSPSSHGMIIIIETLRRIQGEEWDIIDDWISDCLYKAHKQLALDEEWHSVGNIRDTDIIEQRKYERNKFSRYQVCLHFINKTVLWTEGLYPKHETAPQENSMVPVYPYSLRPDPVHPRSILSHFDFPPVWLKVFRIAVSGVAEPLLRDEWRRVVSNGEGYGFHPSYVFPAELGPLVRSSDGAQILGLREYSDLPKAEESSTFGWSATLPDPYDDPDCYDDHD